MRGAKQWGSPVRAHSGRVSRGHVRRWIAAAAAVVPLAASLLVASPVPSLATAESTQPPVVESSAGLPRAEDVSGPEQPDPALLDLALPDPAQEVPTQVVTTDPVPDVGAAPAAEGPTTSAGAPDSASAGTAASGGISHRTESASQPADAAALLRAPDGEAPRPNGAEPSGLNLYTAAGLDEPVKTVTADAPEAGIRVVRQWNKVSGPATGPIRAGEVLQFHTAITNTGTNTWTAANPLRYESSLDELTTGAVYSGSRTGTHPSYCAPMEWSANCGSGIAQSGSSLSHSFALAPGATRYISVRLQVRNSFADSLLLTDTARVSGVLAAELPQFAVDARLAAPVTAQLPDLTFVTERWTKVAGAAQGPIRAGDVLQYHVAVRNSGTGDWTAKSAWAEDRLATITTDTSGLRDDAIILGARAGAHASYCAPTEWSPYCGSAPAVQPDGVISQSFALNAGATYYVNVRIQITNDFLAGDQRLAHTFVASGDPGTGVPSVERTAEFDDRVSVQHPDLAFSDARWTKVAGKAGGPIRAGDVLQYHVAVQNTGPGDWTAKSAWAAERLATITADVSRLRDDAVILGSRVGSSAYYCGPTEWSPYCGTAHPVAADGTIAERFALAAGAKQFFNVRIQITNDFLAGDQRLDAVFAASGAPGNGQPDIARTHEFSEHVTVQHPNLEFANARWTKVAGKAGGPIRAGDVLQYHVALHNTGAGDWTAKSAWAAERLATITADVSGLRDDAVFLGSRVGASAYYCGPTEWSPYCGTAPAVTADGTVTETFALAAGATQYFNLRIQVTSDFLAGDQRLESVFTTTGDPGNGEPRIMHTHEFSDSVETEHPDLKISDARWTKVAGKAGGPIRPGDVLQYHVAVQNTGAGDWTAKSAWAAERLATITADVSGLRDDAVILGSRVGPSAYYCGPTEWSPYCGTAPTVAGDGTITERFALAAGATQYFNVRIQITNDFLAGDHRLNAVVTTTGDPGNEQPLITRTHEFSDPVEVQHPDLAFSDARWTKVAGKADGPIRAGDVLQYHVAVQNTGAGDWTAKTAWAADRLAQISADVSGLQDDAVIIGARVGASASYCAATEWSPYCGTSPAVTADGKISESFPLAAGAKVYFNVRIQITNDFLAGDQRLDTVFTTSGEPGNDRPRIVDSHAFSERVTVQHPDLKIQRQLWTKVAGDPKGPVRAGDVLQYHVAVKNTGDGDWVGKSSWAKETLARFSSDLTDVLDDAVFLESRTGSHASYCGPTEMTVSCGSALPAPVDGKIVSDLTLPSGAVQYMNYRVRVSDAYTGDHRLVNPVCATGDPGNGEAAV